MRTWPGRAAWLSMREDPSQTSDYCYHVSGRGRQRFSSAIPIASKSSIRSWPVARGL